MSSQTYDAGRDRYILIKHPEEAMEAIKQAHCWATRQLEDATDPGRIGILTEERKRLAGIYSRLKDVRGPSSHVVRRA